MENALACKNRYSCFIDKEIGESENITNEDLLELDCDILVPSALETQITEQMSTVFSN